jgi:hypothetical protein
MYRYLDFARSIWSAAGVALAAACLLALTAGCGSAEGSRAVAGKVTFQATPVTAGKITFEDPANGFASSADLDSSGAYQVSLPDGNYNVSIQPPTVQMDAGAESPPDEGYQNVDNIPQRFRRAETSGLSAEVAQDHIEHSFELSP